jgi:N-(5'phosphoribosyl)anthranilate (PRA) isomerase
VYKSTHVKGWWIEVRLSSIRLSSFLLPRLLRLVRFRYPKHRTSHSRLSFILAGGLTPTNIRAAIDAVHPWAVDVFFGVEQADAGDGEVGVGKDPRLVKRFVYAVWGEEEEDER